MKKRIIILLILIINILFIATFISAKNDSYEWEDIKDSDWNVKEDSSKNIFDAVMIFEKIVKNDSKVKKGDFYYSVARRIRILSENGKDWSDGNILFSNKDDKIEYLVGRTILPNGEIIELQEDHIFEKEAVKVKGEKLNQLSFSMPGVTDNCIIEYAYKIKSEESNPEWIAQKDIAVLNGELRWVLAKLNFSNISTEFLDEYLTPNYLVLNRYSKVDIVNLPEDKPETLLFKTGYIPPFESEPFSIAENSLKTKLICYYGSNKSPIQYWGTQSERIADNFIEFTKKTKLIEEIISPIRELENDDEKILAAYDWINNNIINLSYYDLFEIDKNGIKKDKKPKDRKSFDDVIKLGYGTRTEINYLFCKMLQELHFNAKLAYAKDRDDELFVKQAKYWQFDYSCVVIYDENGPSKYISAGHEFMPIDEMPWYTEGATALIAGGDLYLNRIPYSSSSQNTIETNYSYTLDEDYEINGDIITKMAGHPARSMRLMLIDEDSSDFQNLVLEEIKEDYPDKEIELNAYKNFDNMNNPVEIDYSIVHPSVTVAGDKLLFKPINYMSNSKNPFDKDERKKSIFFNYAYQNSEYAEFKIPSDLKVEALPQNTVFDNIIGECNVSFSSSDSTLIVKRKFTLKAPFWFIDDYKLIQNLYDARELSNNLIVVLSQQ